MLMEIGARLKEIRESKGLSLRELHEITKIQPKYLSALEEEKFEIFPGDVYIKGALRNYAAVLGLNTAEILEAYFEKYEKDTLANQENITLSKAKSKKETLSPPNGLNKGKVIVLLLLTGFIVWLIYYTASRVELSFLTGNNIEQIQVDDTDTEADIPPETEDPSPEENDFEQVEETVEVILIHEDAKAQVFAVKNAEIISLEMKFSADCWIEIRKEGVPIFENTFRKDETYFLESDKELTIRIGNPPGVFAIIVNGTSLSIREEAKPYNITLQIN